MRFGPRTVRWSDLAVLMAVLLAACSASSAPGSTPVTASPRAPTQVPTSAPTPVPTPEPKPSGSAPPAPYDKALIAGEPWLVYAWYPEALFLVRPDGSDRHALDLGVPGVPFAPTWSADGERIAFVLRGDETSSPNGAIWTANSDGSQAALFYDGNGECSDGAFWPSWSPDGKRLAMVCYHVDGEAGFSEISVLDVATMVRTDYVTLNYPETIDNPPSWSPDGSTLAFEIITWDPTDTFVSQSVIATKRAPTAGDSGPVKRLTDPTLFAAHPDWSPDGSLIAFNTYDTGNMHGIEQPSNVYTIAPDGSGLRQVSKASIDGKMRLGQPFWSSDGTRIWVSVGRDWEKDSTGQFKNTLGWVDVATGEFHEIGTEGKRFRERPGP